VTVRDDPSLQWLDLSDFTPGIDSAHHSLTRESPSTDGSATVEGTWSCYGLPGGGLAHVRKDRIACVHTLGGDPVNQTRVPGRASCER